MEAYKKEYTFHLIDALKRRLVSKLLHDYMNIYAKQYPNLAIFARDHVGIRVQVDGIYEKPYLEFFIEWLKSKNFNFSGIALDVGANIGNHSVFFSNYFNEVISFEPNPSTYRLLSYNATLGNNIITYNLGVSDISQTTNMTTMDGNAGGAYVDENGHIKIELINLDDFLNYKEKINLIKIDVEGHELMALKGMKKIISTNKPLIVFEQHLRDFKNGTSDVIDYLKGLGYYRFAYIEDGVVQSGFIKKIKNIYSKLFGRIERKIFIEENITPGFYIFIIAIHKENEDFLYNEK